MLARSSRQCYFLSNIFQSYYEVSALRQLGTAGGHVVDMAVDRYMLCTLIAHEMQTRHFPRLFSDNLVADFAVELDFGHILYLYQSRLCLRLSVFCLCQFVE